MSSHRRKRRNNIDYVILTRVLSTYLPREELIRRIRYLEPNHTFRERWQYSNLMYVVAGYLAGYVEGTTWENWWSSGSCCP